MEQLRGFLKSGAPFRRIRPAEATGWGASGALAAPGQWTQNRPSPSAFRARLVSREEMSAAQADWSLLAARALEPSPFDGPDFLLSAARHLTFEARPRFVAVHDVGGRLAGVFPLAPAALLGAGGFLRLWSADSSAPVPPLIDRDRAEEVLAAFFDWAGAQNLAVGVVFPGLPVGGALHERLAAGRRHEFFDAGTRAALRRDGVAEDEKADAAWPILSRTPAEMREAVERFLTLEALARQSTGRAAFDSRQATFLRSATRLLATQGRCRALALHLAGRAVAMALLVESGGHSALWRLAVDARTCPSGSRCLLDLLTIVQRARPEIAATSCGGLARPGPAWSGQPVADIAVSLRGGFEAACRREKNRRLWRALAERAANRLSMSREA
jgi:Acetyltransferase (GNAT) domain